MLPYVPQIGVFGKTGAGKSSLCNLFAGREVCAISAVEACTREKQEVTLTVEGQDIVLLDVPGVGENGERDKEYRDLYESLLPNLDLVLWILKADERAYADDEKFYFRLVKCHQEQGKPVFMVLSQSDKMEPALEWNEEAGQPSPTQAQRIDQKRLSVAGYFGLPLKQVVPVAVPGSYGLEILKSSILGMLPQQKKVTENRGAFEIPSEREKRYAKIRAYQETPVYQERLELYKRKNAERAQAIEARKQKRLDSVQINLLHHQKIWQQCQEAEKLANYTGLKRVLYKKYLDTKKSFQKE
jgi:small GTP-binding protein